MNELLDKLIVFTFCIGLYLQHINDGYLVVPVIIAIGVSALSSYWDHPYFKWGALAGYTVACLFQPALTFFLPLIAYDLPEEKWRWPIVLILLPILVNYEFRPQSASLLILLFTGIAGVIKYRTLSLIKLKDEYALLRDTTKEFSLQLENKNKELLEKQDYEINFATLNERNRIAREIHDSIGHLLSSSILQIGALLAVSKEQPVKENLTVLKTTLTEGMDNIRSSIHDLHDGSIDLYGEIKALVDGFHFCPITLDYDMDNTALPKKIKYTWIAVIKEALSNIIKHSNATQVRLILQEHPALYQLIIKDNGTRQSMPGDEGIGLKNMAERIASLNGIININHSNGFVIFISIPKEQAHENTDH